MNNILIRIKLKNNLALTGANIIKVFLIQQE